MKISHVKSSCESITRSGLDTISTRLLIPLAALLASCSSNARVELPEGAGKPRLSPNDFQTLVVPERFAAEDTAGCSPKRSLISKRDPAPSANVERIKDSLELATNLARSAATLSMISTLKIAAEAEPVVNINTSRNAASLPDISTTIHSLLSFSDVDYTLAYKNITLKYINEIILECLDPASESVLDSTNVKPRLKLIEEQILKYQEDLNPKSLAPEELRIKKELIANLTALSEAIISYNSQQSVTDYQLPRLSCLPITPESNNIIYTLKTTPEDTLGTVLEKINQEFPTSPPRTLDDLLRVHNSFCGLYNKLTPESSFTKTIFKNSSQIDLYFCPEAPSADFIKRQNVFTSFSLASNDKLRELLANNENLRIYLGVIATSNPEYTVASSNEDLFIKLLETIQTEGPLEPFEFYDFLERALNAESGIGKLLASSDPKVAGDSLEIVLSLLQGKSAGTINLTGTELLNDFDQYLSKPLEFSQQLLEKGTCGPTAALLAIAKFYPLELLRITSDLYLKGQADLDTTSSKEKLIQLYSELESIPNSQVLNTMLQTTLMEFSNGADNYNLQEDVHFTADGKTKNGSGSTVGMTFELLSLISQQPYAIAQLDKNLEEETLHVLSELTDEHPIMLSIEWEKHTEDEIAKELEQTGGERDSAFTENNYSRHAVIFKGYDAESQMVLIVNPHLAYKGEKNLTEPLNDNENEITRYGWAPGIEAIPLAEFIAREKFYTLPEKIAGEFKELKDNIIVSSFSEPEQSDNKNFLTGCYAASAILATSILGIYAKHLLLLIALRREDRYARKSRTDKDE